MVIMYWLRQCKRDLNALANLVMSGFLKGCIAGVAGVCVGGIYHVCATKPWRHHGRPNDPETGPPPVYIPLTTVHPGDST